MARGALKSKKRFGGGVLEPSHHVKLTYQDKEEKNQLNILEEAQLINGFSAIRKDYDLLEHALHTLDCIYRVSQEGDQISQDLYNLLGHNLKNLSKENIILDLDLPILKLQFYLKFLSEQGVLQLESWMAPYLKVSMADHERLREIIKNDKNKISFVENITQQYLVHAKVD